MKFPASGKLRWNPSSLQHRPVKPEAIFKLYTLPESSAPIIHLAAILCLLRVRSQGTGRVHKLIFAFGVPAGLDFYLPQVLLA